MLAVGTDDGYVFLLGAQEESSDEIPVYHKVGTVTETIRYLKFSPGIYYLHV